MKETLKELKIEIEAIKKAQTESKIQIENQKKWTGTTDTSITNRMQEMEENFSGVEDATVWKVISVKEKTKTKKVTTQNCGGILVLPDEVGRRGPVSRVLGAGRGVASLV